MPSNFTEHYNLSQWEADDIIHREDFNSDNAKIDAAIKAEADARAAAVQAVNQRVDGLADKADASALEALQTALAAKADASTVTALSQTVAKKADTSTVTSLSQTVDGLSSSKADASTVTALTKTVNGKADASTVTALSKTVNGKADASTVTALSQTVNGKADASTVTSLSQTVSGLSSSKADASTVTALSQTVAKKADASTVTSLSQTVASLGNCELFTGAYVGNGKYGSSNAITLIFPRKPMVVFLSTQDTESDDHGTPIFNIVFNGMSIAPFGTLGTPNKLTWGEKKLTWYADTTDAKEQLNKAGKTYRYTALLV